MKTFQEWQDMQSPESVLVEKMTKLAKSLEEELQSFSGERFDGFLEITGTVRELRQKLANLKQGADTPSWLSK